MEKVTIKTKFAGFLRKVRPQFILFLLISSVFGVVLFFTYQNYSYFLYGLLLAAFGFLILLIIQFAFYNWEVKKAQRGVYNSKEESDLLLKIYQEKYSELTEEYRLYKQQMAEKQSEQMDYFSLWLHQIKTPISAISLLLQQEEAETKTKNYKKMEQELLQLTDYTHMALNYLKLEETGKELEIERFSLDSVIKSALKKYSILFIYNKIQLDYLPLNMEVWSDKKWVQVLIEQILSNSLKYTNGGTIRLYTEGEQLVIEDTGSGISQQDLPKIFEKGYTGLDGRLNEKSTGLGLFISKKISKRLDHPLNIESELAVGTKVRIDFSKKETVLFD